MGSNPLFLRCPATSRLGSRTFASRRFSLAFLISLILAAGTADIILPDISGAAGDVSEPTEPIASAVDDYCRVRRDGLTDFRLALADASPGPVEPATSVQPASTLAPPPLAPGMGSEHQSSLSRRSRAPGLHAG
jgi:hypothetical protein